MIDARSDDLRSGRERSFRFEEPTAVLEARHVGEVVGTLEAAESAARRGLWAVGFVAYEAAPAFDPALLVHPPVPDLPLAWFALFARRVEVDPPPPAVDASADEAPSPWRPTVDAATYRDRIATIREAIAAGDTYQVNYTVRLRARVEGDARGLYRDLALAQRGGHATYLDTGRHRIVSASPELFFALDRGTITTRPMKGTAARGRFEDEDITIAAELRTSAKDRAENAMIVDLLRNDLGRIARPGTVAVPAMFDLERYETVWQLTSTVTCEPRPGTTLADAFRALFPCGSVTGAPKVRTMERIRELEDAPRGVYCGAIGWVGPGDGADITASFNVAIRTVAIDGATGDAEYGVGGGITYASDADHEYAEVLAKARLLTTTRPAFELLETLRVDADGYADLEEHLERLAASARYFGFAFDAAAARADLERQRADARHPRRVRLALARDGARTLTTAELPEDPGGPVEVELDDDPVDPSDVWLFHKTTRRAAYDRRAARHDREAILVNDRGEVTETPIANVAVRIDGSWWTPPRQAGLLAGTARARLLREGTLRERTITRDELRSADELALVSSVRGWRAATLVG